MQLFSDMSRNLDDINILGLSLSIVIYGNLNFNYYILLAFFWSADCSGLVCKTYIVFHIEGCLVVAYLERPISTFSQLLQVGSVNHDIS